MVGYQPMQRDFVGNFVEDWFIVTVLVEIMLITLWGYSIYIREVLVTA